MLRKTVGHKREEVHEELQALYYSSNIIPVIKGRRMRLGGGMWHDEGEE
jgi:hypothetical protein